MSQLGPSASSRALTARQDLVAALASPATYSIKEPVVVCETHASWVFLAGRWAYKVKKPVRLAFLDYSTLERRHHALREELRVNRELGGDIYKEVLAVLFDADGVRFAPDGRSDAAEYALRMHRFDEHLTLAGAIADGRLSGRDVDAVAQRIARFHRQASVCEALDANAVLELWQANLRELEQLPGCPPIAPARTFGGAFVAANEQQLMQRARAGLVRDGHGDLRCEHVLLGEQVRIVDRIEFDASLRCIDVGLDLAFLAMDLELHGEPAAVRRLLAAYREAGGDPGSEELVSFFAAYWAFVRAKVAMIARVQQAGRLAEPTAARRLFELAERLCWRARGAVAIILAGPPASGKSTLAAVLSARSGLPILSSDATRKRLAGLAPGQRAPAELYTRERTRETYRTLGESAARQLAEGSAVILDATCRTTDERSELLQALGCDAGRVLFSECRVPLACALERSARRMSQPGRVSDATPEIVARLFGSYEEIREPELPVAHVDGRASLDQQIQTVTEAADQRLADGYVVLPHARRVSSAGTPYRLP